MRLGLLMKRWTTNKTDIDAHIHKSRFFWVVHFIKYFNMGCGVHLPHVMTKLRSDENPVNLIWASKVSHAIGLGDVWDSQYWKDLHPKKSEKEIIWFVNYHELEIIHG
jgi:hypothetical protein